jgi:hypothetical protein
MSCRNSRGSTQLTASIPNISAPPGAITTAAGFYMAVNDPIIARVRFVDGAERPVFEGLDGRHYVVDDDGDRVRGVWFIPPDGHIELPVVVDCR